MDQYPKKLEKLLFLDQDLYLSATCICLLPVSVCNLYLSATCSCLLPVYIVVTCIYLLTISVCYLYLFNSCICLLPVSVCFLYMSATCICLLPVSVCCLYVTCIMPLPVQVYGEWPAAVLPACLLLPPHAPHARGQGPTGGGQTCSVRQALVSQYCTPESGTIMYARLW